MYDTSLKAKWSRLLEDSSRRFDPEELAYPTEAQLDLLKAALLPAEQAAPAWQRWKERGRPLDELHGPSTRLFPQLWANRDAAGIGAEDLPLLKGAYRHTLAANAVKLRAALNATRPLVEAGIPVLFLKGAAMIAIAGGRLGLRPFIDVDILVRESEAERAVALLLDTGHVSRIGPAVIGLNHSWSCAKPDGAELDLHWWANKTPGDDSGIFEGARESLLLEHSVLVPSPTDCLVITVAGAFFPDQGSPLRWITDSMLLFEASGDGIDWDTVLNRARRPGLTLGLAAGLEFLAREFSAPVPDYVIDELHRRPVSWQERAAHWAALKRPQVGVYFISHFLRQNARRRHYSAGLPRDLLWHLAQITRGPQGRRRDLLKRAPKTAVRKTAVLAVGYFSRAISRQR